MSMEIKDPKDVYNLLNKAAQISEKSSTEWKKLEEKLLDTIVGMVVILAKDGMELGDKREILPGEIFMATSSVLSRIHDGIVSEPFFAEVLGRVFFEMRDKVIFHE